MSYLVLARKYRPQVFEDVVGQEHVTRTLANAISSGRIAHAYLFCGPRGIGKTTVARILAKALNCQTGPTAVPCNECQNCLEITGGRSMDVLEIDGASNRGINEVRELRENTRYAPASGRFKVYIIDEVHMLTHEAFNALLKTLEEPPSHVVFVLATTEPFKVPGTILSRCQRFDFARIPSRRIAQHLASLMTREGIEATPEALSLVARRAEGGVRDALSLMDQVIAAVDGPVDRPAIERFLGLVGADFYYALTDLLATEDAGGALKLLDEIYSRGADLRELASGLTSHLRDLLMLRLDDALASVVDAPESELPRLKAQADRFEKDVLAELVDRAAETAVALRRSDHPRLTMELALAEMAQAAGAVPMAELAERLLELEKKMGGGPVGGRNSIALSEGTNSGGRQRSTVESRIGSATGKPAKPTAPAKEDAESLSSDGEEDNEAAVLWKDCLAALREHSMLLWSTVKDATAVGFGESDSLLIRPAVGGGLVAHLLEEDEHRRILAGIFASLHAPVSRLALEGQETERREEPKTKDAVSAKPSAKKKNASADKTGKPAKDEGGMGQLFQDEPMLQDVLDMFDGEVLP